MPTGVVRHRRLSDVASSDDVRHVRAAVTSVLRKERSVVLDIADLRLQHPARAGVFCACQSLLLLSAPVPSSLSPVRVGTSSRLPRRPHGVARPVGSTPRMPEWELLLANAHAVKNMPGRKTDVADAEWLALLCECGLLRGSFVPRR